MNEYNMEIIGFIIFVIIIYIIIGFLISALNVIFRYDPLDYDEIEIKEETFFVILAWPMAIICYVLLKIFHLLINILKYILKQKSKFTK